MSKHMGLRLLPVCAVLALAIAGCGGSTDAIAPSPTAEPATERPSPTVAAAAPSATAVPEASATATEAAVATVAPSATAPSPAAEIEIEGTDEFVDWTRQALDALAAVAPEWYEQVTASIDVIVAVPAGSGMDVFTKTYMVGEVTAYAPGFPPESQLVWYAGTIVHDSCHSERYEDGLVYLGREGEVACLMDQKAALELLDTGTYFTDYVQDLIDGADDPANEYWNNPNRHW